jgi:hypothetical protein
VPKRVPDRIRGYTSLADHEGGVHEGHVVVAEHDGATLRRIWHRGRWWWSVVDVVGALVESADGATHWRVLKNRLKQEGADQTVTECNGLKLPATDGKMRVTDCATLETLLRLVQSVPSKRAEPIKRFLADVGAERIEERATPSAGIERAIRAYRAMGRPTAWINLRLKNVSARNELTDEWKRRGIDGAGKIAGVTKAMSEVMLGVSPKHHRTMKSLGRDHDLRDHFDGLELAIATLGEEAAKALVVERDTRGYQPTRAASMEGAEVAGDARRAIEARLGRPGRQRLELPRARRPRRRGDHGTAATCGRRRTMSEPTIARVVHAIDLAVPLPTIYHWTPSGETA